MPSVRFSTARDLFDAFPTAKHDILAKPTNEGWLEFVASLMAKSEWNDTVGFCAYLLPRREAVHWACQSVRVLSQHRTSDEEAALDAAEAWVRNPEETQRRAALDIGNRSPQDLPGTWTALAAGWSGGVMLQSEKGPVAAQPYQTPKAVRAAILMAFTQVNIRERDRLIRPCIDHAVRMASGDATGV